MDSTSSDTTANLEISNKPSFFSTFTRNQKIGMGLAVLLVVGGIVGLGAVLLLGNTIKTESEKKKEIISNVLKNNSLEVLETIAEEQKSKSTGTNRTPQNVGDATNAPTNNSINIPPATTATNQVTKEYIAKKMRHRSPALTASNYRYTFSKVEYGNSYNVCDNPWQSADENNTTEYFEYMPYSSTKYRTKVVEKTTDDQLNLFTLNTYDPETSSPKYLTFRDGEYAAEVSYEPYYPESYPNSYPESMSQEDEYTYYEEEGEYYFGENYKLEGERTANGKKYYIIRTEYRVEGCDITDSNTKKWIDLYWINQSSYQVEKVETYISTTNNPESLVTLREYKTEIRQLSDTETGKRLNDIFTYQYGKEIRSYNYVYDYNFERFVDTNVESLSTGFQQFLHPVMPESYSLVNFYMPEVNYLPEAFSFGLDREFYPSDERGQKLFERSVYGYDLEKFGKRVYTANWTRALYSFYNRIEVAAYGSEATDSQMLRWFGINENNQDQQYVGERTLEIATEGVITPVSAKVYKYNSYFYGEAMSDMPGNPESYPMSYPNNAYVTCAKVYNCYTTSYVFLIELNSGAKFTITISDESAGVNINDVKFTLNNLVVNSEVRKNIFRQMLSSTNYYWH